MYADVGRGVGEEARKNRPFWLLGFVDTCARWPSNSRCEWKLSGVDIKSEVSRTQLRQPRAIDAPWVRKVSHQLVDPLPLRQAVGYHGVGGQDWDESLHRFSGELRMTLQGAREERR